MRGRGNKKSQSSIAGSAGSMDKMECAREVNMDRNVEDGTISYFISLEIGVRCPAIPS